MILKSKKVINLIMAEFREEYGFAPSIEIYACDNAAETLESILEKNFNEFCSERDLDFSYRQLLNEDPDKLEELMDEFEMSYEENEYLTFKDEYGYFRYEVASLKDWNTKDTVMPNIDKDIEL